MLWTPAWLLAQLGLPEPQTAEDITNIAHAALGLLRSDDKASKFKYVEKSGQRWAARPYIGPKKQRHLGSFDTPEEAAEEIISFLCSQRPLPPSPKQRNKRGEGRAPRIRALRRKGAPHMPCPIAFLDAYPCISRVPFVLLLCRWSTGFAPDEHHPEEEGQAGQAFGSCHTCCSRATRTQSRQRYCCCSEPMVHVHAVCVDAAVACDVAVRLSMQ